MTFGQPTVYHLNELPAEGEGVVIRKETAATDGKGILRCWSRIPWRVWLKEYHGRGAGDDSAYHEMIPPNQTCRIFLDMDFKEEKLPIIHDVLHIVQKVYYALNTYREGELRRHDPRSIPEGIGHPFILHSCVWSAPGVFSRMSFHVIFSIRVASLDLVGRILRELCIIGARQKPVFASIDGQLYGRNKSLRVPDSPKVGSDAPPLQILDEEFLKLHDVHGFFVGASPKHSDLYITYPEPEVIPWGEEIVKSRRKHLGDGVARTSFLSQALPFTDGSTQHGIVNSFVAAITHKIPPDQEIRLTTPQFFPAFGTSRMSTLLLLLHPGYPCVWRGEGGSHGNNGTSVQISIHEAAKDPLTHTCTCQFASLTCFHPACKKGKQSVLKYFPGSENSCEMAIY